MPPASEVTETHACNVTILTAHCIPCVLLNLCDSSLVYCTSHLLYLWLTFSFFCGVWGQIYAIYSNFHFAFQTSCLTLLLFCPQTFALLPEDSSRPLNPRPAGKPSVTASFAALKGDLFFHKDLVKCLGIVLVSR